MVNRVDCPEAFLKQSRACAPFMAVLPHARLSGV